MAAGWTGDGLLRPNSRYPELAHPAGLLARISVLGRRDRRLLGGRGAAVPLGVRQRRLAGPPRPAPVLGPPARGVLGSWPGLGVCDAVRPPRRRPPDAAARPAAAGRNAGGLPPKAAGAVRFPGARGGTAPC